MQPFSIGASFVLWGHLKVFGDIFVVTTGEGICCTPLVGRGEGYCETSNNEHPTMNKTAPSGQDFCSQCHYYWSWEVSPGLRNNHWEVLPLVYQLPATSSVVRCCLENKESCYQFCNRPVRTKLCPWWGHIVFKMKNFLNYKIIFAHMKNENFRKVENRKVALRKISLPR